MTEEKLSFQAEVGRLLDIVAHSLYSHKEIFLRELVSNASDACDKLRYEALTRPELIAGDPELKIELAADPKVLTVTVSDNGIGMNRAELIENLGTIARSGTLAYAQKLTGDAKKDTALIGQFGVGFYASFMVAGKVEVVSRRAGEDQAWRWTSDGQGEFTIAEAERAGRGTTVTLHLHEAEKEYAESFRLRSIVKTYSDHIAVPIVMAGEDGKEEKLNAASALWTRPAKDIASEQYAEFYHHHGHVFDEPWLILHNTVEGVVSYTNLLFVPTSRPLDLFQPDRKPHVKLYVKRVFITGDCEELLPSYLRFLRGVVDVEDLPLNISREMLQHNPQLAKIKSGLAKRVLGELGKKAEKEPDAYAQFWETFGAVLKEGIYEDFAQRDALLELARFRSTHGEGWTSLADYLGRMKDGQEAIYFIVGDDARAVAKSPQLEGFKAKGIEVLLLADPIDEFWIGAVGRHKDKPFQSATRGGIDLSKIKTEEADKPAAPESDGGDTDRLIAAIKLALGEAVKDVRRSDRLTDSAVCLVADEHDMDLHFQRMMRAHRQMDAASPRILEINPAHPLIKALARLAAAEGGVDRVTEPARLLLDQARIVEGEPPTDPQAFARRLADLMEKGLTL